jgi:hypothetical protein
MPATSPGRVPSGKKSFSVKAYPARLSRASTRSMIRLTSVMQPIFFTSSGVK